MSKLRLSLATFLVKIAQRVHMDVLMKFTTPVTIGELRAQPWYAIDGDHTLRLQYPLDQNSVVFDLGGFQGDWAHDIWQLYQPTICVFEPVTEYASNIERRFANNPKVKVFPIGLGNENREDTIFLNGNWSSSFQGNHSPATQARFVRASEFWASQGIGRIDLMKINIEGGEYELLEHLLDTGLVPQIGNLQIQFHDFVPLASRRMARIQDRLSLTHELTYQYEFMWENWRLKSV
jgi:FkbM family methyltransferase